MTATDPRSLLPAPPQPEPPRAEFDASLAFLREGYDFGRRRFEKLGTDVFSTRIGLAKAVFVQGEEAARMFYDAAEKFTRKGALPQTALRLLQDKGSVMWLDGPAHHHRKAMFLSVLLDEGKVGALVEAFGREWRHSLPDWERRGQVNLLDEAHLLLTAAVAGWTGLGLPREAMPGLSAQLSSMFSNAGRIGPKNWWALLRSAWFKRRLQRRLAALRQDLSALPEGAPARVVLEHREPDGRPLPLPIAAVEIVNFMRPTVAVGRYVVWAAIALHRHPEWRERFRAGDEEMLEPFAEEVRRFFPFIPLMGGRVRKPFQWRGIRFPRGAWVMLDLDATNHDARRYPEPFRFRPSAEPDRGMGWRQQGFDLLAQGGGDARVTHRCPGEFLTVELIKEAVRVLSREMDYSLPPQDLTVRRNGIPARPESGLVLEARRRV